MLSKTLAVAAALFVCVGFKSDDGLKRERGEDAAKNAAKDSYEGKAPPKLEMELWMNAPRPKSRTTSSWSLNGYYKETVSEEETAPTWDTLKGKVVVLDFWAYW